MAEKKENFWSFLTRPIQNMSDYVTRGVTNLIWWRSWGDDNLDFWTITDYRWERFTNGNTRGADSISAPSVSSIKKTPTVTNITTGWTTWWVQVPDLTMPENSLTSTQEQDIADTQETVVPEPEAQEGSQLTAREIIEWAWVKNTVDVLTEEEKIKKEDWKWTLTDAAGWVAKFFFKTINPMYWGYQLADTTRKRAKFQADEDVVAVWYNPDNWNIMQLALNKWQWLFDDFWNTFWQRGKWNDTTFARLYWDYNDTIRWIYYSDLDNEAKSQLFNEAFKSFKKEVEDRQLIKVYENDLYSDWLFAPIFMKDAKVKWRMKDKFSQEELDNLAKSDIKEWWIYKLTDWQFQAFLDAYDNNNELRNELRPSEDEDWQSFIAWLDDESRAAAVAAQQHAVLNWVTQQLTAQMEAGAITPVKRNEIENRIMSVVDERINTMWLYLDWPLSFYSLIKQKNPGDLTEWERAILWYGPWIINFMEDYTNALTKWAEETVRTWIKDWELATVPDTIDWMSVNDFFNNAIKNSNIQAWWVDLLATESAVDAMQLINQNINHLYWKDKWNRMRRTWSEAWYWAWSYWYTAMELGQMWVNYIIWWWIWQSLWADMPDWAKRAQDYHRADWLTASLAETDDPTILWSSDLGRLVKEYWLKLTDIAWETAWLLIAEKPFLGVTWNAARKSYRAIKAAERWIKDVTKAQVEAWKLTRLYNSVKTSLWNTKIAWWTRRYLANAIDKISPQADAKIRAILELSKQWLNRIVRDQLIDTTSTYLDTESFSTPSYWLSVWLTWVFELLPHVLGTAQIGKMITNKIRWLKALDNTWWKMIDVMTSDPEIMKAFEKQLWTNHPTFQMMKKLAQNGWWWEFENALKLMYNQLNPEAQLAMNRFSKELMTEQLSRLTKIDWNSSYGKNLRAIIDANWTNISDIWKYIFGIPGQVDIGWFSSSILFKEWGDLQTRYLTKNYPVALDNIDWGFRSKIQNWFTREDIEQIASKTPYKSVLKDGRINDELFEAIEDWKYALNWKWAKALWLDVSEYTEAMAKADIIRKEAEWTKEFLDENLQKLAEWRWISKATIDKVVDSWAFNRMINEFERIVC